MVKFELSVCMQADVCHAYKILRDNKVKTERIITMMVDDIANNPE